MSKKQHETEEEPVTSLLLDAFALTNGDRNESYGSFSEDYTRVCDFWETFTQGEPVIMDPPLATMFMHFVKLSRLSHKFASGVAYSTPEMVRDDLTDGQGYLDGVWQCLNEPPEPDDTCDLSEEDE